MIPKQQANYKILFPSLFILSLLLMWEMYSQTSPALQFLLPPPSHILASLWERFGVFAHHTRATLREMTWGMILALCLAFPLAWGMALKEGVRLILQPLFVLFQCIPMFTLAPLMVMWLGWSFSAILIPTALMILFPLTLNIYQGIRSTPQELLEYFYSQEASTWHTLTKLCLPYSIPYIFAGLRISAAVAGVGAIAGEWAGAQEGLGILILQARQTFDIEGIFASLLCLSLLSVSFYGGICMAEWVCWNKRVSKKGFLLLSLLLTAFLFLGCGRKEESSKTRLLLDWMPNPNHVPLYAGQKKGVFKKYGIDLQILKLHDSGDTLGFLSSEQAELALYYTPHALRAAERSPFFRVVGCLIPEALNALLFREEQPIYTIQDLNGKTIAGSYSFFSRAIFKYLEKKGIQPLSQKNVAFDLSPLIGTGAADVVTGMYWNIEGEQLSSRGVPTRHFKVKDLGIPDYSELIVLESQSSSEKNPTLAPLFQKALQECIDYSRSHPEEAFQLYAQSHPEKSSATLEWEHRTWLKTKELLPQNQDPNREQWQGIYSWLVELEMLEGHLNLEQLFL